MIWSPDGWRRFGAALVGLAIVLPLVSRLLRLGVIGASAVTSAGLLIAFGALLPLVVVVALTIASVVVGARLRRWWRDVPIAGDDPLVDLVVGIGVYGTLVSLLAHVPVSHPATFALLIGLPIVLDRLATIDRLRAWWRAARTEPRAPLVAWVAGVLATLYAIVALLPEVGFDALAMHLFIPSHLWIHRAWSFDPTRYSWALMPTLVDWLYGIGYVLEGERAARLVNAASVGLLAALVHRLAALAGATRGWCWFAAALTLATPVVFTVGSSLFIDTIWSVFVVASVLAVMRPGVPGQPPRGWITAAALAGFAAAAKAVTLPMLPALAVLAAFRYRALIPRGSMRVLALATGAFVVFACKPYLTAWLVTGNPVYPFFMHVLGGQPQLVQWGVGPQHFKAPLAWTTLYDATFASTRFIEGHPGAPGFQWLLLLPAAVLALIATWHRRGLALVVASLVMIAIVFHFMAYLRYVLPAFCLLIAAIAVAGTALRERAPAAATAFAAIGAIAIGANLAFFNAAGFYPSFPLESVVTESRRRQFLDNEAPIRSAIDLADRLPAAGRRLAVFGQPAFAAAPGAEFVHPSWYTALFLRDVAAIDTSDRLIETLVDWEVRHVIVQAGPGDARLKRLVEPATSVHTSFRGVTVREIPRDRYFRRELLQQPDLGGVAGWTLFEGARHDATQRALVVTMTAPAFQTVAVSPGASYLNTVKARCDRGQARVQVNWLDARNRFIGAALQAFDCKADWSVHEQEVTAPRNARFAVVYATSATSNPVEIGAVSFRGT